MYWETLNFRGDSAGISVKMPLKRSRASTSAKPSFDGYKFISTAAEQRYDKGMRNKVAIMESGFEITHGLFPEIDGMIANRHW